MNKFAFIGMVLGLLVIGGAFFFFQQEKNESASISGMIDFTRLKPDPGDEGEIIVMYKPYRSLDAFKESGVVTELSDGARWTWNGARAGEIYEVVAELRIRDDVVKISEPVVVTAPAESITLHLPVTWDDLPDFVVQDQTVSMSGSIQVNGYIPPGAVLNVEAKTPDMSYYEFVWTNESPRDTNPWEWQQAVPKKQYELRATLMRAGENIGTSSPIRIDGMKTDSVLFSLNSTASHDIPKPTAIVTTAPAPGKTATIRGTLTINGPELANTSALIMWSKPGENKWNEITRLKNPENGTKSWQWQGAQAGQQYEIGISLQVDEKTTATTPNQVVSAPASNINFVLNSGVSVPQPQNKPSLVSCANASNGQWDANLSIPVDTRYGNYWWQVGTSMGNGELVNAKVKPPSNDSQVRVTVRVNDRQTYYARHAYSFCTACSADINFSTFSNTLSFSCGQPAPTPTLTPTSIPTATPSPTVPPNTSRCNESCGSNGYTCVLGLSCVTGDVIGESACRNPNCTDRIDCICRD